MIDVYLICHVCKTITEGTGSGDLTDSVTCNKCSNSFITKSTFRYKKYEKNEEGFLNYNGKRLHIPVELEIC